MRREPVIRGKEEERDEQSWQRDGVRKLRDAGGGILAQSFVVKHAIQQMAHQDLEGRSSPRGRRCRGLNAQREHLKGLAFEEGSSQARHG